MPHQDPMVRAVKARERARAWRLANPERASAKDKAWRLANPEKCRSYHKAWVRRCPDKQRGYDLKRYSLTCEQFDDMLISQGGRCKLCSTDKPGGKHSRFNVDHCVVEDKVKVRGLLCHRCNTGIGSLNHDPKLLIKAANYVTNLGNI